MTIREFIKEQGSYAAAARATNGQITERQWRRWDQDEQPILHEGSRRLLEDYGVTV